MKNIDDGPYFKDPFSPEMVASFTKILFEVKDAVSLPLGVNVLRNGAKTALALGLCFKLQIHKGKCAN
ncbi:MAG: BtpA/SgcQ family protein [Nitrososphaeria archaeon]